MTAPVSGVPTVPVVTPTTSVDRPDQMGKDMFLQLLVAQMRYQDPNSPASTTEFMSQTATFSQVEKLEELTKQNAEALGLQRSLSAGALVGHTVSWTDASGATKSGAVTSVRFDYGEPVAVVGGTEVPFGRLTEVAQSAG